MKNRSLQIFCTLLTFEALLLTLAGVYENAWGDEAERTAFAFKYPTLTEVFNYRPTEGGAVDSFLTNYLNKENALSGSAPASIQDDKDFMSGGLGAFYGSGVYQFDAVETDSIAVNRVQYQAYGDGTTPLDNFLSGLLTLSQTPPDKQTSPCRILHYGDSHIEGDRITQFLRGYFQNHFGGSGLGFVPIDEIANHHSYQRYISENWKRYNVFSYYAPHPYYGASGNLFRFQPATKELHDAPPSAQALRAFFRLAVDSRVKYDTYKLAWGRAPVDCYVTGTVRDSVAFVDTLRATDGFQLTPLAFPPNAHNFSLTFSAQASPDVYGIWLDGRGGVQVDNYALRGHSGNGLLRINSDFLAAQLAQLNARLVILQYGGNVVPYPNVTDFSWFEEDVYKMLVKFKKAAPQTDILVVGVADAAYKAGGVLRSYPTVRKIRDAQKNAAFRAGCAFWDLYEVMGGENSMVSWAAQGLAAADYAHLGYMGQKLVGRMLFNALMKEYNVYLRRQLEAAQVAGPTDELAPSKRDSDSATLPKMRLNHFGKDTGK